MFTSVLTDARFVDAYTRTSMPLNEFLSRGWVGYVDVFIDHYRIGSVYVHAEGAYSEGGGDATDALLAQCLHMCYLDSAYTYV